MIRTDNRGISLIELITVVAIVAIVITIVPMSFSSIYSTEAKRCAEDLDGMLAECRIGNMCRAGDTYIRITRESDGVYGEYYENDMLKERDKIGNRYVTVKATDSNGHVVDAAVNDIVISFERSTGSITDIGRSMMLYNGETVENDAVYKTITMTSSNRTYYITIDSLTGNHVVTRAD